MTSISTGSVVTLNYFLKDDQDNILDSSDETGPMIYIQGSKDILQAIEESVQGLSINDRVEVSIAPADAYGDYNPELVTSLPIEDFKSFDNLQQGMQIQEETTSGPQLVTVKEVTDNQVLIDGNHPLAGQTLHFELQVTAIRKASSDEIDHGHVHHSHNHEH